MIKASLTINGVEVDLYDDESVTISDSIKSTKDVANVSTSYTREFRLPASRTNNKLFQHYYNTLIRNGFDSRRKHEAIIKINGADFKKGYIKLNGVDMVNNKADSYRVQFFGELSSLKDKMGEDMLEDLTALARFNHDYDQATVKSGFESALKSTGSGLIVDDDGQLIYPFISHTRGFKYDNNGLSDVTVAGAPSANDRLSFDDLKPAIKVDEVLRAMEYKYDVSFGGEFRDTPMFQELFLWLHREKGFVRNGQDVENLNFQGAITRLDPDLQPAPELELALDSGNEQRDLQTYGQVGGKLGKNYKCKFEVQTADPGSYTMNVIAIPYFTGGEPLNFTLVNQTGNSDPLEFDLYSYGVGTNVEYWQVWVYVNAENTISTITPIVTIDEYFGNTLIDTGVYGNSVEGIVKFIDIPSNMPKMRCIDFIRGLYRMFNLVVYDQNEAVYSSNSDIILEPLDDFYDSGSVSNLSSHLDISKASVERVEPFNLIEFKFKEPKTLFTKKSNEVQRINFGEARFDSGSLSQGDTSFLYDGGSYTVELPFEKSQYERMTNVDTGNLTQLMWGWFVNDFEENVPEPEIGAPLLFLRNHKDCNTDTIEWSDTSVTNTKYNAPSNVSTDQENTINFDAEVDEFTLEVNENGLFNKFYKRFIEGIYDIDARRYIAEAYLPIERIFNYKLNDKVVINHTAFNIEDIKINMSTRKTRLELLKITARDEVYDVEPCFSFKILNESYAAAQWSEGKILWMPGGMSFLAGDDNGSRKPRLWSVATAFTTDATGVAPTVDGLDNDRSFEFGDDGNILYGLKRGTSMSGYLLRQYNLSTPYDVTTATLNGDDGVGAWEFHVSNDGTKLFRSTLDTVTEYSLSTAWDVTTASFVKNRAFGINALNRGFDMSSDGRFMLSTQTTGGRFINLWQMETAYDIDTAILIEQAPIPLNLTGTIRVAFGDDDSKAYLTNRDVTGTEPDFFTLSLCLPKKDIVLDIPVGNLVSYQRFNNTVEDQTNNHIPVGSGISYSNGIYSAGANESVLFSANTDHVNIPDSDLLSFGDGSTDSPFSISGAVNFNNLNTNNWILEKRDGAANNNREYSLFYASSVGTIRFLLYDDSAGAFILRSFNTSISTSTNYHFVITYSGGGASSDINLYLNGVLDNGATLDSGTYTAMENLSGEVRIGSLKTGGSATSALDGRLDGLGIWNKELTQAEVTDIYNKQSSGNEIL